VLSTTVLRDTKYYANRAGRTAGDPVSTHRCQLPELQRVLLAARFGAAAALTFASCLAVSAEIALFARACGPVTARACKDAGAMALARERSRPARGMGLVTTTLTGARTLFLLFRLFRRDQLTRHGGLAHTCRVDLRGGYSAETWTS
jgi:hypothetical protein